MALNIRDYASAVRVSDGAWGTELQAQGLPAGAAPELWNVENPGAVRAVADGYVRSGSDVILTNTFGANRLILAAHGLADRAAELGRAGVQISRQAAGEQAKVFASIGPSGKIVMMGEIDESVFAAAFAEAARAAQDGGADAVLFESFAELAELTIALRAAREACELPLAASMTFSSGPDGSATMMGDTVDAFVRAAAECGAAAVGANCGVGPVNYVRVAGLLRQSTDLPIWIKPNAGVPHVDSAGRTVFPMGSEEFASYVPALAEAGASFIGGCCGTTPGHIRAVRQAVDKIATGRI